MDLIVNDLPQHGLLLHGPASPGFRDRLNALIEIPADFDEERDLGNGDDGRVVIRIVCVDIK